jgi:hypothetical protein
MDQVTKVTPRTPQGCEECLAMGGALGAPPVMSHLRLRGMLLFLSQPPCHQALPGCRGPDRALVRAR